MVETAGKIFENNFRNAPLVTLFNEHGPAEWGPHVLALNRYVEILKKSSLNMPW